MAKDPKKPPSSPTGPSANPYPPPRKLGRHGASLWNAVMSEYHIEDRGGVELLAQACAALDRIEALAERISTDGEVIPPTGRSRIHACATNWRPVASCAERSSVSASMSKPSSRLGVLGGGDMPTKRIYIRRPHRTRLSGEAELDLWLGPSSHRPPAFDSDEQRAAAWCRHRDRLLLLVGSNGHRPLAWWRYEAPFPYPGYDSEQSTLYEADLLAETERAELVAFWREQFDRASDPNFFFTGRGEILRGEAAHRAHCRWADIPPSLIEAWSAERERSAEAPTLPGRSQ